MAFLKKHFLWILLGLVLLGEGVFTFFLLGKRGDAAKKLTQLAEQRRVYAGLRRKDPGRAEVIAALNANKAAVQLELGDCLLFFWYRDRLLERLFEDKGLDVKPWGTPPQMDVFRARVHSSYTRAATELAGRALEKLNIERKGLGLVEPDNILQPYVTVGDIFAVRKEFWLIKEVVDIGIETKMAELVNLKLARGEEALGRIHPLKIRRGKAQKAELFEPVKVDVTVRCEYPRFGDFLEALHRSPIGFRLKSVKEIRQSEQLVVRAGAERRAAAGGAEAEGAAEKAEEAAGAGFESAPLLVKATLECEVPDFNIDVHQVTFDKRHFRTRAKVEEWVNKGVADLRAERKRLLDPKRKKRRPLWIRKAERYVQKQKEAAQEGKAVKIRFKDGWTGREYDFTGLLKGALQWLKDRHDFELLRVEARLELWERVAKALAAQKREGKKGLVITLRPKDHFDLGQMYPDLMEEKGNIRVQFGLVKYKPQESEQGIGRDRRKG